MARRKSRRRRAPGSEDGEWIGGRLRPPWFIEDRGEPYRPELVLWLEQPSGLVVGQALLAPEEAPGAVGRAPYGRFSRKSPAGLVITRGLSDLEVSAQSTDVRSSPK